MHQSIGQISVLSAVKVVDRCGFTVLGDSDWWSHLVGVTDYLHQTEEAVVLCGLLCSDWPLLFFQIWCLLAFIGTPRGSKGGDGISATVMPHSGLGYAAAGMMEGFY